MLACLKRGPFPLSMNGPCCRATRALYFSGTTNIEQVIQWIVDHENDPDLEQPLLVPKVSPRDTQLLHNYYTMPPETAPASHPACASPCMHSPLRAERHVVAETMLHDR